MKSYPSLTKLPAKVQWTLYLIREELKIRKLFHTLEKVGFCDSVFEPSLDPLIMNYIGINTDDETFARYTKIMDKRSKKIMEDEESVTRQALKAYHQLIKER